jgi:hypothetical protein
MMETTPRLDLITFLSLAQKGHCPLFHRDWIKESLQESTLTHKPMTLAQARRVVDATFKKLDEHKSLEKKQVVLQALKSELRNEFIRSFFKVVEFKSLDELKELH